MLNRKFSPLLILIVLAVFVTAAGCSRKTPEQRAQGIVNSIAERLDLNDAQKAKLNTIKEEFLQKAPAMRKSREETGDQLLALMRSPRIDPDQLKALVDRNKAQADDFIGFLGDKFTEFHDMLTPEQREKAAKEMERWREHAREHH